MINILGVHIGHDSSACLVQDGRIMADVAEERFCRIKHYAGLPIKSIDYCLSSASLTMDNIDIIAIPTKGQCPELNHLFSLNGDMRELPGKRKRILEYVERVLNSPEPKPPLYVEMFTIGGKTEIVKVDHHLAHAASAYYTSGSYDKQLIVTMDGLGDGTSIGIWIGEEGRISKLQTFDRSHSLGWFYGNVTEALGWYHGDGEGKTMGLAPYGDPIALKGVLDGFYPKFSNGECIESHDFGKCYFWNENGAFQWHFDDAYEIKKLIEKHGRENVAAEAQRVLEEQTFQIIFPWLEKYKLGRLCCAGGIFLNVKLNQRIWESGKLSHQHIYPNAGDGGLAAGAALYSYNQLVSNKMDQKLDHLYLGPEFSNDEIEEVLKGRNLSYKYIENIEQMTAKLLSQDKIVAWFQGRMESGPRALGNRSILMSANKAENKDIINALVKFREAFRPFCPSLIEEKKDDYLENNRLEAFMITSFSVTDKKVDKIPAVVHVDDTLRPQTVSRDVNPSYWNLINEFGRITGEYLILNTSFNIMGEPIVCNPREAIRCFYDSGIDAMAIGNYFLLK